MSNAERFDTISALVAVQGSVRLWCFRCDRGRDWTATHMHALLARRGIAEDSLHRLRSFMRCDLCRMKDQVLVLPARGPDWIGDPPDTSGWTSADLVAALFHGIRAQRKRQKRG